MNIFVARQPIFDKNKNVVAYELLYRSNLNNKYTAEDGNKATYKVIANSFYTIGIEKLTEGKRALINFTEDLLKEEIGTVIKFSDDSIGECYLKALEWVNNFFTR